MSTITAAAAQIEAAAKNICGWLWSTPRQHNQFLLESIQSQKSDFDTNPT